MHNSLFQVILIAAMIHRPATAVQQIYQSAPIAQLLAVSLVESEAWFDPKALNLNWNETSTEIISTDWGYWQLNSKYHPQFRNDSATHVRYGANNFARVLFEQKYNFRAAISAYNTGNPRSPRGLAWADKVLVLYERLRVFLWP